MKSSCCAPSVFQQLAVVRQYVRCREVRMYTYGKESDGTHVLLPDKRKACLNILLT